MNAALQKEGSAFWYAARTRYGQELKVRDRLVREGVEHFIPTVPAEGPRKEKAAINNLVFLKATKAEAPGGSGEADGRLPSRAGPEPR